MATPESSKSPATRSARQATLKAPIRLEGRSAQGSHSIIDIKPAGPGTGIVFVKGGHRIPVNFFNVRLKSRPYRTIILRDRESGEKVYTAEHILGALKAMGVHNAEIHMVKGSALPCFSDAVSPYVREIEHVGLKEQDARVPRLRVNLQAAGDMLMTGREVNERLSKAGVSAASGIKFADDEQLVVVTHPNPKIGDMMILRPTEDTPKVTYYFDYPHKAFGGPQTYTWTIGDTKTFKEDIMHARAPGFYPRNWVGQKLMDITGALRMHGMTYENTLILGHPSNPNYLNPPGGATGVRYGGQEGARHKTIDLLGEMSFLPGHPKADVISIRTGHKTSTQFMSKLLRKGVLIPE